MFRQSGSLRPHLCTMLSGLAAAAVAPTLMFFHQAYRGCLKPAHLFLQ